LMQIVKVAAPGGSSLPPSPKSYWRRFWSDAYLKALPWLLGIAFVVNIAEAHGYFDRWAMPGFDVLAQSQLQKIPTDIFVVEITDQNYKDFFGETSPLKPQPVINLITTIASAHPTVIGVDIDTRSPKWESANANSVQNFSGNPTVVWAEVPLEAKPADQTHEPTLLYQEILICFFVRRATRSRIGLRLVRIVLFEKSRSSPQLSPFLTRSRTLPAKQTARENISVFPPATIGIKSYRRVNSLEPTGK
jgi:hypothetical protein